MTSMKSALDLALKTRTKGKETPELAQGELVLLHSGTIRRMFHPAPITKKPHFLINVGSCVHLVHEYDEVSEGFITNTVKCRYRPEAGFLCKLHDSQLLARKVQARSRDFDAETVQCIVNVEGKALAEARVEVIGGKYSIKFLAGVRMKSNPDLVKVPEPHNFNLNIEPPKAVDRK